MVGLSTQHFFHTFSSIANFFVFFYHHFFAKFINFQHCSRVGGMNGMWKCEWKKVSNITQPDFPNNRQQFFVYSLWVSVTKEMRYQTEVFIRNCLSILVANFEWNVSILIGCVFVSRLLLRSTFKHKQLRSTSRTLSIHFN